MSETKARNSSIDLFRIIFSIMIIMAHTYFLKDICPAISFWTSRAIARISVPFFLCTTGYFYIRGLTNGKDTFKKQIISILKTYVFWTIIYYILSFVLAIKNNEPMNTFIKERITNFFFKGSYYHFWYFPALIYPFILAAICYKLWKLKGIQILAYVSVLVYIVFFIGTEYIQLGHHIPILNNLYTLSGYNEIQGILGMGLPFFMMGYFVNASVNWHNKITPSKSTVLFAICFSGFILETIYAAHKISLEHAVEEISVAITLLPSLFFFFIFLLKHPYPQYEKHTSYCRRMSNYIYFTHPIFIAVIEVFASILHIYISNTPMFFIVATLTIISGTIFYKINNKYTKLLV